MYKLNNPDLEREMGLNLKRTTEAIERYDKLSDKFDKAIDNRDEDFWGILEELELAEKEVGHAYGLDTAHINDMGTCEQCVKPGFKNPIGGRNWLRDLVNKHNKGEN